MDNLSASNGLNMPYGVTPLSHDIYNLHMTVFYVSCFIGAVVFILIIYSLFKFRKSKGAIPATFTENHVLETIWTIIPFIILICLAIPATRILGNIHDTEESALTIKITGYQWKWEYEYLDHGIKFFSFLSTPLDQINGHAKKNKWFLLEVDNPVVVPINTKVKLLITSQDVIHDWWVPELGLKQDAVPGFINENWFKIKEVGEYRGQCGELCGVNHAFMPIVVKAVTQEEFMQWVSTQRNKQIEQDKADQKPLTHAEILAKGKTEYERNCAMCHQNDGEGLTYTYPALQYSRVVTAPLDETILYILRGVPSAAMQPFGKILDNKSLAAIVTYIRESWGNAAIIKQENYALTATPQDIQKMRATLNAD